MASTNTNTNFYFMLYYYAKNIFKTIIYLIIWENMFTTLKRAVLYIKVCFRYLTNQLWNKYKQRCIWRVNACWILCIREFSRSPYSKSFGMKIYLAGQNEQKSFVYNKLICNWRKVSCILCNFTQIAHFSFCTFLVQLLITWVVKDNLICILADSLSYTLDYYIEIKTKCQCITSKVKFLSTWYFICSNIISLSDPSLK